MYGKEYLEHRDAAKVLAEIDAVIDKTPPEIRPLVLSKLKAKYSIPDWQGELQRCLETSTNIDPQRQAIGSPFVNAANFCGSLGRSVVPFR